MDGLEHGRAASLRIDIPGGRDADGTRQSRRQIGQNIGMQIGRHHRIDRARLHHHAHRHRIDQLLVPGHVLVVVGDQGSDLIPEHHAVPLRVRLGHHGQMLPRARTRDIEREPHDPLHAAAGEDGNFGGDFFRQAAMGAAALAGIFAFRVFTHDHPVQIAFAYVPQRGRHTRQNAGRADVGILIQTLADL